MGCATPRGASWKLVYVESLWLASGASTLGALHARSSVKLLCAPGHPHWPATAAALCGWRMVMNHVMCSHAVGAKLGCAAIVWCIDVLWPCQACASHPMRAA
eukprot:scaffold123258_cov30-Tisochrysis_lutea.AAC.1